MQKDFYSEKKGGRVSTKGIIEDHHIRKDSRGGAKGKKKEGQHRTAPWDQSYSKVSQEGVLREDSER